MKMDECISREAMLKNLTADLEHHSDECDPRSILVMRRIIKYVEDFPATDVQPVDRWISIEESKPKDMQQVLAVVDGDVREAFYNAGCFIGSNFYRSINEVKWWQPLPEPPKDGGANG
jgi:hypothetical protein